MGVIFRFLVKLYTGRGNRLAITIAMVFICLGAADVLGFSDLLACMAMSAVFVNTSNESDIVFSQTDRMTPPIFMLFFFLSGADLDLRVLPSVGLVGILYIVFRVVGKGFGSALRGQNLKGGTGGSEVSRLCACTAGRSCDRTCVNCYVSCSGVWKNDPDRCIMRHRNL